MDLKKNDHMKTHAKIQVCQTKRMSCIKFNIETILPKVDSNYQDNESVEAIQTKNRL